MAILSEDGILTRLCIAERALETGKSPAISGWEGALSPQERRTKATDYFRSLRIESLKDSKWETNRIEKIRDVVGGGIGSEKIRSEAFFVHDFEISNLNGMAYDLRVGDEVFLSSQKLPVKLSGPTSKNDTISIEPGEFALIMTHEYLYLPLNLMGFISVRMKYKSKGLVNISGFHVDSGFSGKIFFAVYNAGPHDIVLRYKEPVFMMLLGDVEPSAPYRNSSYQGQTELQTELISQLHGTSVSPRKLDERLTRLENLVYYALVPVAVGVVVAVISYFLRV